MRTYKINSTQQRAYSTPTETVAERRQREARALQVARQMLQNGCCANTIVRYTGLREEMLRQL